jgi:hypothetical protein
MEKMKKICGMIRKKKALNNYVDKSYVNECNDDLFNIAHNEK